MEFVSVVNCMDGRVQEPVINWMKKKYNAEYVDMITEPGPIKILSDNSDKCLVDSIKSKLVVSVEKHGSKVIAVVGHHDCAGNPSDKQTQINQIKNSINLIKTWFNDVEIIGLWVNEKWQVEKVF
ncbi:MAG: carbonic anhydrase [Desulfurella sp.]|uniref:carbonic anhydrase n=1 Tax=Desulfurella sp. TaxID=1962857 RepID=UPI003D131563